MDEENPKLGMCILPKKYGSNHKILENDKKIKYKLNISNILTFLLDLLNNII